MVSVDCVIYKGRRQPDSYLYVAMVDEQAVSLERVPDDLLRLLGDLEEVMRLTLDAGRRLAQADIHQVLDDLQGQGYYLQLPPDPAAIQASLSS